MRLRCPISLADSGIMSFRGADAGTGVMPVFLALHRHSVSLASSRRDVSLSLSPLRRLFALRHAVSLTSRRDQTCPTHERHDFLLCDQFQ